MLGLVDPAHARPLWSRPHRLHEAAVFRPRAADGIAVCGGLREITAWNLADGTQLWRYPAQVQIGVPLLHGGRVYFGDGHELVALDLASGKPQWRFPAIAETQISYAPAATGNTVFVGPGDGRLYALATEDGQPRWTIERMGEWQYLRQLHIDGAVLVAGSYKEKLHGIDLANGRQLWEFNAGNFINSHHVAAGVAYLWSPTGWLYAIDAQSGAMRWRHRTTDYRGSAGSWASLLAELVTQDKHLFALDLNHVLHAIDIASGEEVARRVLPEPVRPFVVPLAGHGLIFGAENGALLLTSLPHNNS